MMVKKVSNRFKNKIGMQAINQIVSVACNNNVQQILPTFISQNESTFYLSKISYVIKTNHFGFELIIEKIHQRIDFRLDKMWFEFNFDLADYARYISNMSQNLNNNRDLISNHFLTAKV